MKGLSDLLRVGYLFVFVKLINSYLLIAANLNDFRAIAEKLVPQDFAHKLAKMVAERDFVKSETSYEHSGYEESDMTGNSRPYLKGKEYAPKKSHQIQETKVDFDELVERVKKRLEEELKNKYLKHKVQNEETTDTGLLEEEEMMQNKNVQSYSKIDNSFYERTSEPPEPERGAEEAVYEDMDYEEAVTVNQDKLTYAPKQIKSTTHERYEYADALEDEPERLKLVHEGRTVREDENYEQGVTSDLFKQVFMKRDSYEDYKIPKKDDVYSSKEKPAYVENKRFKIQQNRHEQNSRQSQKSTGKVKYDYKGYASKELVTDHVTNNSSDTIILSDLKADKNVKAAKKGTMIPKRERYKIVTPNYVDRIPNVAERYNFNEPLPVRDREREIIKYIGNPPASINKKVDPKNPINQYVYTNYGLKPLSLRNIMQYTEIPPKFRATQIKKVIFDYDERRALFEGTFEGRPGKKRLI